MILELQVKQVYGQDRIYPMNETARKVTDLLKRKTLTKDEIDILKAIGFTLKWVPVSL